MAIARRINYSGGSEWEGVEGMNAFYCGPESTPENEFHPKRDENSV